MILFWISNIPRPYKYSVILQFPISSPWLYKHDIKNANENSKNARVTLKKSRSDRLSPRMKSQSIYCRLDHVLQGKRQIHIIFLSVTFCICCILQFRFSRQTRHNTCSWNPPALTHAALLGTRVIPVTAVSFHFCVFTQGQIFILFLFKWALG